jgi:hypothetical protein
MAKLEKIYEAFGELIYSIAKSDGDIQKEEKEELLKVIKDHKWAYDIIWSFDYENEKNRLSVKDAFTKAMNVFKQHGPFAEYEQFILVLEKVAGAFQGINSEEMALITNFRTELTQHFKDSPNVK